MNNNNRHVLVLFAAILIVIIIALFLVYGISHSETNVKGLAQATDHPEDRTSLGISWWYTWGENCNGQAGCVNMARSMQLPVACYDYLLVGNEPNAIEPYGAPISPTSAARLIRAIQRQCPYTQLVVGNVSADDWSTVGGWGSGYNWLKKFLSEYRRLYRRSYTGSLGTHCYQTLSGWCVQQLTAMRGLYAGEMWVTEFGVMDGDTTQFSQLLDYIATNFTRYAVYTNRQPPSPCDWCGPDTLDLVNDGGTLRPNGIIYSQR